MMSHRTVERGNGLEWWRPVAAAGVQDDVLLTSGLATTADDRSGSVAFWSMMSFTVIVFMAPQHFFPVLAPLRLVIVTAAIAAVAHLASRFVRHQSLTVVTAELKIAAALAAWAILTVPLSFAPDTSVAFLGGVYFKALALFWLLANTVNTPARLSQLAWAIGLMMAPMAATALFNFLALSGSPDVETAAQRIAGFHTALMANPNDLALMLNLMIPLTAALLLAGPRPAVRVLLVGVLLLDIAAVIVTFSRGGFVTLAAMAAIYMWKLRGRLNRSWATAAIVVMLAALPLLPSGYLARMASITDIESDITGSSQVRWNDLQAAFSLVLENPIVGVGAGMSTHALGAVRGAHWRTTFHAVHNAYLEIAVEFGIPGLILFLLLLVGCIKSVGLVQHRCEKDGAAGTFFHLAQGIQISVMAFSVAALFHPMYYLHFYYVAGMAVAVTAVDASQRVAPALRQPAIRRL